MLYGKPENLLDKLFNYIQSTKDEKLELKPNEFNENTQSFESKFEQMNETIIKDKNSIITNENKIICDNINLIFNITKIKLQNDTIIKLYLY